MLLIVSYWHIIQMTYYKLYKYLTTLAISRTENIETATIPHLLNLCYRLNTIRADVGCYLPPCNREAREEFVKRWANALHGASAAKPLPKGSYRCQANPFSGTQPCPRTLAFPREWLFRQCSWRRLRNCFAFYTCPARHKRLTVPIVSQFLMVLVTLAKNEARGSITVTSLLLLRRLASLRYAED